MFQALFIFFNALIAFYLWMLFVLTEICKDMLEHEEGFIDPVNRLLTVYMIEYVYLKLIKKD